MYECLVAAAARTRPLGSWSLPRMRVAHGVCLFDYASGVFERELSGIRERDAALGAYEERLAQLDFESLIWWLTADCVRLSFCDARVKLRVSATARKSATEIAPSFRSLFESMDEYS